MSKLLHRILIIFIILMFYVLYPVKQIFCEFYRAFLNMNITNDIKDKYMSMTKSAIRAIKNGRAF